MVPEAPSRAKIPTRNPQPGLCRARADRRAPLAATCHRAAWCSPVPCCAGDARRGQGLPSRLLIVYRRLTMNIVKPLDRGTAETYAAWFKALADGTRVQVVSLLARAGRPLTVREIVAVVPVGQSTVSEHLRQLAAVGFVLVEERGTSRLYRINGDCVSCFPTAADLVMGKPSPVPSAIPAA